MLAGKKLSFKKGRGDWNTMFANGENIVALCDVDLTQLDRG